MDISTMEKQCVIQLLPLPRELISIVKEYAFHHKDYIVARRRYNQVMRLIEESTYKQNTHPERFWFWSENHADVQFQTDFCPVCGNYTYEMGTIVPCSC